VDPNGIILPPLHIELALMKTFVKAMDEDCAGIPNGKISQGINPSENHRGIRGYFVGTQGTSEKKLQLRQNSQPIGTG